MPRSETANIGKLVERGLRATFWKRVADRSLALPGHIEHHRCERHTGRILQAAHVFSDQTRVAGVRDTETGLRIVDEDVVAVVLEPDGAGGGIEARFRFLLAHRSGF